LPAITDAILHGVRLHGVRRFATGGAMALVGVFLGACGAETPSAERVVTTSSTTPTTTSSPTSTSPSSVGPASPSSAISSVTVNSLSASLQAEPSSGPAGTTVLFTIEATESQPAAPISYEIDFGDGTEQGSGKSPPCSAPENPSSDTWHLSHTYSSDGKFTVLLTVTASRSDCTAPPDQVSPQVTITIS